jgi:hypothetical protein
MQNSGQVSLLRVTQSTPFFVQNLATNNTTCLKNVTKQIILGFLIAKLRHFWPQLPTLNLRFVEA